MNLSRPPAPVLHTSKGCGSRMHTGAIWDEYPLCTCLGCSQKRRGGEPRAPHPIPSSSGDGVTWFQTFKGHTLKRGWGEAGGSREQALGYPGEWTVPERNFSANPKHFPLQFL